MASNNFLRILEISANYRNLHIKKLDLSNVEAGHLRILGEVGAGKTNLIEFLRLTTQGVDGLRNKDINPDGKAKVFGEIKLSDNFYLAVSKTKTGDITTSLYAKDSEGRKINAIQAGKKVTPSEYKEMLTTELSYGVEKFLSDNPRIQWEFISKIYRKELIAKGLIGDENDTNTLTFALKQAILKRDVAQVSQSKLGAYKKHLEDDYNFTRPEYIDVTAIQQEIKVAQDKIQTLKEAIIAINEKNQQDYAIELQKAEIEYNDACKVIDQQIADLTATLKNNEQVVEQQYQLAVAKLEKEIADHNQVQKDACDTKAAIKARVNNWYLEFAEISKALKLTDKSEISISFKKDVIDPLVAQVKAIPEALPLRDFSAEKAAIVKNTPEGDTAKLEALHNQKQAIVKRVVPDAIKHFYNITDIMIIQSPIEQQTQINTLIGDISKLNTKLSKAKENAEINDKFDAYEAYTEADELVASVRSQIKKAYAEVNTGVEGMVLFYDTEKDNLCVMYDGRCFGQSELKVLSSFSHTQKRFIAAQLQLHLLKQKRNPLNVLFFDELGMDEKTDKLFDDFAKLHGLVIITTGTGDYEPDELSDNEILVENGTLFFGELATNFTEEEQNAFIKDAAKADEGESVEAKPKKGRSKKSDIDLPPVNDANTGSLFD